MVMIWSDQEEARLIELYMESDMKVSEIAVEINKTFKSVEGKIARLKSKGKIQNRTRKWSEEDDIYLELVVDDKESSLQEVADFLGRSRAAVVTRLTNLRKQNLNLQTIHHIWTGDEIEKLKVLYPYKTSSWLAEYFRTTRHSVLKKAESLGLTGGERKVHHIKHLDSEIRKLCAEGKTRSEIAEALGLPYQTIKKYIWENKIPCKKADTSEGWLKYHRDQNQISF